MGHCIRGYNHGSQYFMKPVKFGNLKVINNLLLILKIGEIMAETSNITSCVTSRNILQGLARWFKTFVHDLKQFSLLRVHASSFQRTDPEKTGVKIAVAVIVA